MSIDWTSLRPWDELSDATQDLILNGDDSRDPHQVAFSVALGMRNAGRGYGDYELAMTDPANGCGRFYREIRDGRPAGGGKKRKNPRGQKAAQRELERAWQATLKAEAPRNPDFDRSQIRMICDRIQQRAERVLPAGQKTRTTLRVLGELCKLAVAHKRLTVTVSCRQLAELAGINKDTAARHLDLLVEAGVIRRVHGDERRQSEAAAYAIINHDREGEGGSSVDTQSHSLTAKGGEDKSVYPIATSPAHLPIWRQVDLGESGRLVFSALDVDEPASAKELHRRTKVSYRTVRVKLPALEGRALAIRSPDGWLRGPANPADVASQDAIDAAKSARISYQNQRVGWQQKLNDRNHLPRSGVLAQPVQPEDFEVPIPGPRNPIVIPATPDPESVSFPCAVELNMMQYVDPIRALYQSGDGDAGYNDSLPFDLGPSPNPATPESKEPEFLTRCHECGGKLPFGEEHLGIHFECEFQNAEVGVL